MKSESQLTKKDPIASKKQTNTDCNNYDIERFKIAQNVKIVFY